MKKKEKKEPINVKKVSGGFDYPINDVTPINKPSIKGLIK